MRLSILGDVVAERCLAPGRVARQIKTANVIDELLPVMGFFDHIKRALFIFEVAEAQPARQHALGGAGEEWVVAMDGSAAPRRGDAEIDVVMAARRLAEHIRDDIARLLTAGGGTQTRVVAD